MNKVNEIVFVRDVYGNDRNKMWERITEQLKILMEQEYVCKIYDDDIDVIVIQYSHDEKKEGWGGEYPYWLTPEQKEFLDSEYEDSEVEEDEK